MLSQLVGDLFRYASLILALSLPFLLFSLHLKVLLFEICIISFAVPGECITDLSTTKNRRKYPSHISQVLFQYKHHQDGMNKCLNRVRDLYH